MESPVYCKGNAGMFTHNESPTDRDIRIALAVVLLITTIFFVHGFWGIITGVLAVVFGVTAATGFCPLYRIFGISTCSPESRN